jgi:arginine utilization regulatory protein
LPGSSPADAPHLGFPSPAAHAPHLLPAEKGLAQLHADLEKQMVCDALAASRGNVSRAAGRLGISRQLLNYKLKKYRIDRRTYMV